MRQYLNLREDFDALQTRVERALRVMIAESKHTSNYRDCKAIQIDCDQFVEIAVVHDRLVALDTDGHEHGIGFFTLDELIDIITQ